MEERLWGPSTVTSFEVTDVHPTGVVCDCKTQFYVKPQYVVTVLDNRRELRVKYSEPTTRVSSLQYSKDKQRHVNKVLRSVQTSLKNSSKASFGATSYFYNKSLVFYVVRKIPGSVQCR